MSWMGMSSQTSISVNWTYRASDFDFNVMSPITAPGYVESVCCISVVNMIRSIVSFMGDFGEPQKMVLPLMLGLWMCCNVQVHLLVVVFCWSCSPSWIC